MIRIGVIGYGYWGPNLVRNLAANRQFEVVAVCDPREDCRDKARRSNARLRVHADAQELIDSADIDAVVIATPIATHFELASRALRAGKHVLVEKPLCTSAEEGEELVALAARSRLVLLVDHVYVFHNAVRKLREFNDTGAIGKLSYYDSLRINLGLFQPDVNVLWDLAPHDFSIMNYILEEEPEYIEATGYCHVNPVLPDIVYVTAHYTSHMIAHLNLSWMSPVKVRRVAVGGSKQMVVWDDLNLEERLKIYDSGIEFRPEKDRLAIVPSYRIGDVHSPRVPNSEALADVIEEFANVICGKQQSSVIDGAAGLRVVRMLEAAQTALDRNLGEIAKKRDVRS